MSSESITEITRNELTGRKTINSALEKLRAYVEGEDFKGYDPYDTLNARFDLSRLGKWPPVLATQFQKRNPLNIRPLLGIEKGYNPKGIGLLLEAYAMLYQEDQTEETLAKARWLFEWLCTHSSEGYSGICWGYNFDWASPVKYLRAHTPSIVVTSTVGKGIFQYYEATGDTHALNVLRSACDFVLHDLPRSETPDGICFSYTPAKKDCCYNASMLGAELLARVSSLTEEKQLRDLATQAVNFVVSHQHDDGRWNYSIDIEAGSERPQVDFHQGFILDSLQACIEHASLREVRYRDALERGTRFYRRQQFTEDGRALWRLPKRWPVDIHCQAQGILTFSRLTHLDRSYLPFAERIAQWTAGHMQDEEGFFYYRKGRMITNKIPYMRWAQAWMMLALAQLLSTSSDRL